MAKTPDKYSTSEKAPVQHQEVAEDLGLSPRDPYPTGDPTPPPVEGVPHNQMPPETTTPAPPPPPPEEPLTRAPAKKEK
jgi:hypothetical protein